MSVDSRPVEDSRKPDEVVWVGGMRELKDFVVIDDQAVRPVALFWFSERPLSRQGGILEHPDEILAKASESLTDAIRYRSFDAKPPTRVIVSDPALADAVRAGHPELVVEYQTPMFKLERLLDVVLRPQTERTPEEIDSFFDLGGDPDAWAAVFRSAASLYRAQPWLWVPKHELLTIDCSFFDLDQAVLRVTGQGRTRFGIHLYQSAEDLQMYDRAVAADDRSSSPPHVDLRFLRGTLTHASLREEIAEHGWEVAGPAAYPVMSVFEKGEILRQATSREFAMITAIATALSQFLVTDSNAVRRAFIGSEPVDHVSSIATHAGDAQLTLWASRRHANTNA